MSLSENCVYNVFSCTIIANDKRYGLVLMSQKTDKAKQTSKRADRQDDLPSEVF